MFRCEDHFFKEQREHARARLSESLRIIQKQLHRSSFLTPDVVESVPKEKITGKNVTKIVSDIAWDFITSNMGVGTAQLVN